MVCRISGPADAMPQGGPYNAQVPIAKLFNISTEYWTQIKCWTLSEVMLEAELELHDFLNVDAAVRDDSKEPTDETQ